MGGVGSKSTSQHEQLNELINKISTDITVNASSKASGSIKQTQDLTIAGVSGSTVSGISQIQNAQLSVKSVQDAVSGADLQNKLISGITNEIEKTKTDFPQLIGSDTNTKIKNVVSNSVQTNFSMSALSSLSMEINQKQKLAVAGISDGAVIKLISQKQSAKGIAEQINKMSNSISNQLLGETNVASKTTDTTKFFASDFAGTIGDSVNNLVKNVGDMFGIDGSTTILIGFVILIAFIYLVMSGGSSKSNIQPMMPPNMYGMPQGMQYGTSPYVINR